MIKVVTFDLEELEQINCVLCGKEMTEGHKCEMTMELFKNMLMEFWNISKPMK